MSRYNLESDRLSSILNLEATADWRGRCAERFPADDRNEKAEKLLSRLAHEIDALNGSPLHRAIEVFVYDENFSVEVSYVLRGIGFSFFPASAEELLERVLAQLRLHCERTKPTLVSGHNP